MKILRTEKAEQYGGPATPDAEKTADDLKEEAAEKSKEESEESKKEAAAEEEGA